MKAYSLLGPPAHTRQLASCRIRESSRLSLPCRPRNARPAADVGPAVCCHSSSSARQRQVCRVAAAGASLDGEPQPRKTESGLGPRLQPTERVLKLWRKANAVCFDVDCEYQSDLYPCCCSANLQHREAKQICRTFNLQQRQQQQQLGDVP
jgi:hypothetical protein